MEYNYVIPTVIAFAALLYYKYVFIPDQKLKKELKEAAKPKDTADAQDDDFCLIASAISKCKTDVHFESCIKAIKTFQDKYGKTFVGEQDVNELIKLYEKQEHKILLAH